MIDLNSLRNDKRQSGFDHVSLHPDERRAKRFRAQFNSRTGPGMGAGFMGRFHASAEGAAADAEEYLNGPGGSAHPHAKRRAARSGSSTKRGHPLSGSIYAVRRRPDNNDPGPSRPVLREASVARNLHYEAFHHPMVVAARSIIEGDFDIKGYWMKPDPLYAWVAMQKHLGLSETMLYCALAGAPKADHLPILEWADGIGFPVVVVVLPADWTVGAAA